MYPLYYNGRLASSNGMEMQTEMPTPGALRTRISDGRRKACFLVMEVDWRAISFPLQVQPDSICPLWDWALVMEMENAEDVRGSHPRKLRLLAVQPCIGGLWKE